MPIRRSRARPGLGRAHVRGPQKPGCFCVETWVYKRPLRRHEVSQTRETMDVTDLQQAASGVADRSRSFLSAQLDARSTRIGATISSTADDLRRIADELRTNAAVPGSADLAERGADAIGRVGRYLQSSDSEQLITDAEEFARQRPWAVTVAALAVGFAASRVLKASSVQRYRSTYGDGGGSTHGT